MSNSDTLSFLESALDRDFYVPKKHFSKTKPPIRVMVTDAGEKIAYNIIYKLCSGIVFGPDQDVILHLNNSKGPVYHKEVAAELFFCGFSCYRDFVVSSTPSVIYRDLDYVILIATYEEVPGWVLTKPFMYQMVKARQVARYVRSYAKPDCKIVLTGPSTKALVSCLGTFRQLAPNIPQSNITCVTSLDVFISKAVLAAKLKTTTNRIKNVIIWSCTYPDVRYATVKMVPPDDVGGTKMKDLPISEVVDDGEWLGRSFRESVFRRIMNRNLLKYGKAIATATAHHLRVLHKGTDSFDEIQSMGLISPPDKNYSLPGGRGYSYPVRVLNGKAEILQNIGVETATFLNRLRVIYSMVDSYMYNSSLKLFAFLMDYEGYKKHALADNSTMTSSQYGWESKAWFNKYFITPNPSEKVTYAPRKVWDSKKSIAWVSEGSKVRQIRLKSSTTIQSTIKSLTETRNETAEEGIRTVKLSENYYY